MFTMLLLLTLVAQPAPPDIKVTYDERQDLTLILMEVAHEKEQGKSSFVMAIYTGHSGKIRPKQLSDLVTLSIDRMGYDYAWQDSHTVRLRCGKALMNHRQDSYESEILKGYHREAVETRIKRGVLRKALDAGKDIQMTIGSNISISFGNEARGKMAALLRYLDEYPGGQHPRGKTR
jgi:hypothetical protein